MTEADDALNAAARSADDLAAARSALDDIPTTEFSADDLKLREDLLGRFSTALADLDSGTIRTAEAAVDNMYASNLAQLQADVETIVAQSANAEVLAANSRFRDDLLEVTHELVVDAACKTILDTIAPQDQPDEPGRGSTWRDPSEEVINRLIARGWNKGSFERVVEWVSYGESIGEDGAQLAKALRNDPALQSEYLNLLARPQVRTAVIEYLRLCYSTPASLR